MINRVVLVGRMTRDAESRTTNNGKTVCSFSLAVDKKFKKQGDEQTADFFRIQAWEKTAEFCVNYLGKGRLVAVDGRLESRKFQDKDGNNREVVEVVADSVQGLDRPRDEQGEVRASPGATTPPVGSDFDIFADE
jgi:single-strand DNA-binding protein